MIYYSLPYRLFKKYRELRDENALLFDYQEACLMASKEVCPSLAGLGKSRKTLTTQMEVVVFYTDAQIDDLIDMRKEPKTIREEIMRDMRERDNLFDGVTLEKLLGFANKRAVYLDENKSKVFKKSKKDKFETEEKRYARARVHGLRESDAFDYAFKHSKKLDELELSPGQQIKEWEASDKIDEYQNAYIKNRTSENPFEIYAPKRLTDAEVKNLKEQLGESKELFCVLIARGYHSSLAAAEAQIGSTMSSQQVRGWELLNTETLYTVPYICHLLAIGAGPIRQEVDPLLL